jgi:RNA polymerase sigma-70 factor (ECF subfamily)
MNSQGTEDYIVFSEIENFANQYINNMPEKRKQVFMLSRMEGLSQEEIAQRLDISVGTVKQHMNKAIHNLSESFRKNDLFTLVMLLTCFFRP